MMDSANDPPLDEIQWRSPPIVAQMGGLHSNTILFYFAESPFFERTSNNAIIMSQALNNMSMYHYIQTREAFEGRLKTMSGLEFIVGEEPAETGPGAGTGVWIIRKQTRRKRYQEPDEITVHASFFVVGENIYKSPSLANILASRIMTISTAMAKALTAAEKAQNWRAATGHVYRPLPNTQAASKQKAPSSKENTPLADALKPTPASRNKTEFSLERAAEEAFLTHIRYGGEYIDENPITGRPGDFHLSSTGRKPVVPPQPPKMDQSPGIGAMNGPEPLNAKVEDRRDSKTEKTPRSATHTKPKRRKSRMSNGPTPAQTPTAS